ncbi:MAG: hypothetical protein J3Q66DRAFT_393132 [Benniella sp.]|nr:MAG: hypothetical protein J3Q66DRAFT_393132 [Benniella sp.]
MLLKERQYPLIVVQVLEREVDSSDLQALRSEQADIHDVDTVMKWRWVDDKDAVERYWGTMSFTRDVYVPSIKNDASGSFERCRTITQSARRTARFDNAVAAHQLKRTLQELWDEVPVYKKSSKTQARLAKATHQTKDTEKETKADLKDDLATLPFGPELPAEARAPSFSGSPPDSGRSSLRSIDIRHDPTSQQRDCIKYSKVNEMVALGKAAEFATKDHSTARSMIRRMCAGTLSEEIVQEMVTTADLFVPSALKDSFIHHAVRVIVVGTFGKLKVVPHCCDGRMWSAGVENTTIVGLLIQERICTVMTMDLRSEALYLLRALGTFLLPGGNLELGLLIPAIAPLTHAKDIVTMTLEAIIHRPAEPQSSRTHGSDGPIA